jgi:CRP-like cAMP-binding protein
MIRIMFENFAAHLVAGADRQRTLDPGTYLCHQGDPVHFVFVVEDGLVELSRHQQDGALIILQRANSQKILAEASLYSDGYHCDAVAILPSSIFALSKAAFRKHLKTDENFSNKWAAHLAHEVQTTRYRCKILSRKTVAERLDGWMAWQGGTLPSKG